MTLHTATLMGLNGAVSGKRELRRASVDEVHWVLNGYGDAKVSMNPLDPDALYVLLNATEIWISLNESLVFQGVPRKASGGLDKVTFDLEGVLSYLEYAYVWANTVTYTALDQHTIGWNLVDIAQTGTNAGRNIASASFGPSGVVRTITYDKDQLPNIWDALVDLTKLDNGFDFDLTYYPDGRREWTPYYPVKGAFKPQYALELDRYGRRHVQDFTYNADGVGQATDVFDSGATLSDNSTDPPTQTKLIGHYESTSKSAAYGRMQKVISDTNIDQIAYLTAKAQAYALGLGDPLKLPEIVVDSGLLGLIFTGDTLPVNIDYGCYQIKGNYRIGEITYNGSDDTLKIGLAA